MASASGRRDVSRQAEAAPTLSKPKRVKVRALRTGYYNEQRYREGNVFYMTPDKDGKLASWVERVAASTPEQVTTGQHEINKENDQVRKDREAKKAAGETDDQDDDSGDASDDGI